MCEYSTYEIAREAGIHTNTVRKYEAWGYISAVPRRKNGYRVFSKIHMEQVLLVRKLLLFTWISGEIRNTALAVINSSVEHNFRVSQEHNNRLQHIIKTELKKAREAIKIVERWYSSDYNEVSEYTMNISEASGTIEISADTIRHWERNRLLKIPRNTENGYRKIGVKELDRLKVIRTLRQAGYSIMAILRMFYSLDKHENVSVRKLLDTPSIHEDVLFLTDKWLSKLKELYKTTQSVDSQLQKLIIYSK